MPSVVIVGAGIIGLSIGWQLAREGYSVHIIQQGMAGRQASWAAAGMLAPYSEASYSHLHLLAPGEQSLALYPRFLTELEEDSRVVLPRESEGTLCVAVRREDRDWLQSQYAFKKKHGMPVFLLSGEEARRKEPLLSPRVNSGLWIPAEKQINNRLLISALKSAFGAKGGKVTENEKIIHLWNSRANALDIRSENGKCYPADIAINAAGAWAQRVCPSHKNIGVNPMKGQILTLKMHRHITVKHMIRTPRIYFAPKQEGVVRVGATSEDLGFCESVTAGAAMELLQNAWEVIPAIAEYQLEEMSVGLRPVIKDHTPLIGATPMKGIYHAVGHGRSGILLAPYTAYVMKQIMVEHSYAN